MTKVDKDPEHLDPLRRALFDAMREKNVSAAQLSRAARGNDYFINKYLWQRNPNRLSLEEGIKIAGELGISPSRLLGDRAELLTREKKAPEIPMEVASTFTEGGENNMNIHFSVAVSALSKLSGDDMVRALERAMEIAEGRSTKGNPTERETAS